MILTHAKVLFHALRRLIPLPASVLSRSLPIEEGHCSSRPVSFIRTLPLSYAPSFPLPFPLPLPPSFRLDTIVAGVGVLFIATLTLLFPRLPCAPSGHYQGLRRHPCPGRSAGGALLLHPARATSFAGRRGDRRHEGCTPSLTLPPSLPPSPRFPSPSAGSKRVTRLMKILAPPLSPPLSSQILGLIDENTAAALLFAVDNVYEQPTNIIFYNLGASSLQVSLVPSCPLSCLFLSPSPSPSCLPPQCQSVVS